MSFRLRQPFYEKMQELLSRIAELEMKVAFQEQTIEELNQALVDQQFALDKLQVQLRHFAEKFKGLAARNASATLLEKQ